MGIWRLSTLLPLAAMLSQPLAAAAPKGTPSIRLTAIPPLTNDHCYESPDPRGVSVVRYFKGDGMWTGINGRIYHFRMADYYTDRATRNLTEVSTDKTVTIHTGAVRTVRVNGESITVRDQIVTMNGARRTFPLYEICPATGPDGD